jgi:hypothetical protein
VVVGMKKKKWCAIIIMITTLLTVLVRQLFHIKTVSITTLTTATCPGTVAPNVIPGSAPPQL